MATFPYTGFPDGVGYPSIAAGTTTVTVASSAALSTALTNASAGQRIVLGSGTYSGAFTMTGKAGTASAGITIEAATPGAAIFASGATLTVKDCQQVTVKGLSFPYELSSGNTVQFRGTTKNFRITRCIFGPTSVGTSGANKTPFIYLGDDCEFGRIDHNEFRNKANPGNAVLGDGNFSTNQVVRHIRVDHNLWRSIKPEVTNEKEPIRFGVSTMSKTFSNSVIERNVFIDCICEPEVISVKACGVRVSGNTVLKSIGGIVYRHGTNGVVTDNYIIDRVGTFGSTIGSGGFRFYDKNHEISYNYVDGVFGGNFQGPLVLDTGDAEGTSTDLSAHWRVVNAMVERNVLVGNPEGIRIGDNYDSAPTGCTIRDNIVAQATTGVAITQRIAPVSTTIGTNPYYATPATGGMAQGSDTIWRKAGYGPRLTYLQPTDVGPSADLSDTDGTGVLAGGSGGGGTVDDGTAASKLGWGAPLAASDEFEYTGAPQSTKWSAYSGPGHDGNGRRDPARVSVANGKMILTGLANGDSAGLAHRFDQQYGRWEVRARSFSNGGATQQTLGVGGVATPAGAEVETGNRGAFTVTTGGTSTNPRVLDGKGFDCGRIDVKADNVVIQNYRVNANDQYGIYIWDRTNVTIQNCDIRNVHAPGDLNVITAHGNNIKIKFNTAINAITGDPGGSHSDFIQTWVSSSHPIASANWEIVGNRAIGPANPSRDNSVPSIHQCIMAEGLGRGGNSGGNGDPHNWLIADNEFGGSWNQDIKLDGVDSVDITRNRFVGSSDRVFEITSASSNVRIYSDNTFSSAYGQVGATITSGSGPGSPTGNTGTYHPVLIIWPTSERWPDDGEIDFLENDAPGEQTAEAYWHYPHAASVPVQQIHFTKAGVDLTQFHNFAIEWTADGLVGYLDGVEWCRAGGGAITSGTSARRDIQAMPSGHLTVQLDNFGDDAGSGTNQDPATFEVEWARVYSLTPSGSPAGDQTVTPVGIVDPGGFGQPEISGGVTSLPPGAVPTRLGVNSVLGVATLGYTAGGTTGPAGNQTLFAVGRIASATAFGRPALALADGPQIVAPTGLVSQAVFGRPIATLGPAPDSAPGGVLVPTLFAVAADGITLSPLPAWASIKISPVRNSAGSLEISYPAGAPGFTLLHDNVSADPLRALEIRVWLGGSQEGALGGWLVQKSGDDLDRGSLWTFSGHFHAWLLQKAIVGPQTISEANKDGSLTFAGATAGLILSTVMDQAQQRGALPLVSRDFTTTHDSNGAPWGNAISSLKLAPKTTLAQVADKLVELGMAEYEFTAGRVWRAFNAEGQGTDRTTGPSPLTFAHARNLSEHSRRESSRDAGTAVLVAGDEGFYEWADSPTKKAQLGWRAEVGVDAGQLTSRAAVQAVAPSYLKTASAGTAEYAAAVEFGAGAAIPLIEYGIGDWAYTVAGTTRRRLRIAQIELEFADDAPVRGKVVLNDLITDQLTKLTRRLNAISTGDAVVGTSTSTPGGAGEDVNPPAAPEGVTVASTFAYQVPGQTVTLAEIGVGWAKVTTNAYASDIIAKQAQAAGLIAARMQSGGFIEEDWSWSGMPGAVSDEARLALLDEWDQDPTNAHEDGATRGAAALAWLTAYPTSHLGGGAITDDVDHYRVQFQYLGSFQTSTKGPRGEDAPDQLLPDSAWEEPVNSPTSQTLLVFGNVEGGRAVGIRVAAVDRTGNQGPWSTVVAVDSASDDTPPPAPSKPTVAPGFRLIRVTWDGKGSSGEDMVAAAPDFLSGGGVEIHVAQGIDFTPDRPFGATGRVDLSLSQTYQATLYDAMTYPVNGLDNGTTYFVRFVAVDRNGNASEVSETSDPVTPQQLVTIDYGPDTIDRATIRAAAIGSAEIDQLAVNESHIGSVSASSITTGIMKADVTVSGRFATPISATGNQLEFDSAGIRLRQGNTVVGRWQTADASMLVTGTYLSALSGKRINILPSGTILMYPPAGTNFGFIENLDGDIRISGQVNTDQRAGYLLIDETRAALTYSQIASYNRPRTRFQVDPIAAASWAPIISQRIDRSLGQPDALGPRWLYTNFTSSGDVGSSIVHLQQVSAASNHAVMYGANSDAGIVFDAGFIGVVHNAITAADIHAAGFIQVSALAAKRDVAPVRAGELTARGIVQAARARSYYYRSDFESRPERPGTMLARRDAKGDPLPDEPGEWTGPQRRPVMHVGPMADDLLKVVPQLVHTELPARGPGPHGGLGLNMGTVAGLAWAAAGELADDHDALAAQVAALTARLDALTVVEGSIVDSEEPDEQP